MYQFTGAMKKKYKKCTKQQQQQNKSNNLVEHTHSFKYLKNNNKYSLIFKSAQRRIKVRN